MNIFSACVVAGLAAGTALAETIPLVNPTFSDDLSSITGWSRSGPGTITTSSQSQDNINPQPPDSNFNDPDDKSLLMFGPRNDACSQQVTFVFQEVAPRLEGDRWTVTAFALERNSDPLTQTFESLDCQLPGEDPPAGGERAVLQLSFRDATGTSIASFEQGITEASLPRSQWTQISATGVQPPGTVSVRVAFFFIQRTADNQDTFADNVRENGAIRFDNVGLEVFPGNPLDRTGDGAVDAFDVADFVDEVSLSAAP
ncbi:MAG: hypothetical protein AAGI30_14065 [Planctomycetota bacterium]